MLTNNAREFEEFWKPLLPLDELFDDVVDSSEVGMRKPAPEIYRLALARMGLRAGTWCSSTTRRATSSARGGGHHARCSIGHERSAVPAAIAAIESHLVG